MDPPVEYSKAKSTLPPGAMSTIEDDEPAPVSEAVQPFPLVVAPASSSKSSEKRVVWAERVVETRRRDRTANNARDFLFEAEDAPAKFLPPGKTEWTPIGRVALSIANTDFGQMKGT